MNNHIDALSNTRLSEDIAHRTIEHLAPEYPASLASLGEPILRMDGEPAYLFTQEQWNILAADVSDVWAKAYKEGQKHMKAIDDQRYQKTVEALAAVKHVAEEDSGDHDCVFWEDIIMLFNGKDYPDDLSSERAYSEREDLF